MKKTSLFYLVHFTPQENKNKTLKNNMSKCWARPSNLSKCKKKSNKFAKDMSNGCRNKETKTIQKSI